MERRERERIMRQGVVLPDSPRRKRELAALEEDLTAHPLKGRRLRQRFRNFTSDAGSYFTSLGGPLPFMARLREIESLIAEHERRLAEAYAESDRSDWASIAARWNFGEVNELIARHNRFYPIEARLPMDPRTGDYVLVNGAPYGRRPLDVTWVLERFPAES